MAHKYETSIFSNETDEAFKELQFPLSKQPDAIGYYFRFCLYISTLNLTF